MRPLMKRQSAEPDRGPWSSPAAWHPGGKLSTHPPDKSSKIATLASKPQSAAAKWDPMKPAPPVTKQRLPEKKSPCLAFQSVSGARTFACEVFMGCSLASHGDRPNRTVSSATFPNARGE